MRLPFLVPAIRQKVIEHMKANAESKNIKILALNGHIDHIHCLVSLNGDVSLSKAIQLLKGESSYWINQNGLSKTKFEWQGEYYASSVSASDIKSVIRYIENQEEHHRTRGFDEEYTKMLKDALSDDEVDEG